MSNRPTLTPSQVGKITAKYSFLIGTAFFLTQLALRVEFLYLIGLFFVIIAAILNGIILLILLFNLVFPPEDRLKILTAIGLMLLNIPVCLLYLHYI